MRHHRIVAQISLILYILNLVLAAPMGVQGIYKTPRGDETDGENAAATDAVESPQHSSLSDGSISSGHPSPDLPESSASLERPPRLILNLPASLDGSVSHPLSPGSEHEAMHTPYSSPSLSDVSISSGYPTPPLSPTPPDTGSYSWLLERPPRPSLNLQTSLYGTTSHPLDPGSSGRPLLAPEDPVLFPFPQWFEQLRPVLSPSASLQELPPLHHPPGSGPAQVLPPQLEGSEQYSHEAMPTLHSPASDGSLSLQYHTASEEPPHHLTPDAAPPSPQASSPSTGALSDSSEFFNENMKKKLKIVAGAVIVGSIIAGIVGSQIKNRNRDYQDS